jgi:LmbE family N-acetylglucosaminyl deacetylase
VSSDASQGYETVFNGAGDRRLRHALLILAHAADLLRYCAGTTLALTGRGARVDLLVVADAVAPLPLAADCLVAAVGVNCATFLRHRSLELPDDADLRSELVRHIRRLRPQLVVAPDPTPMLRMHPDHRAVARAALDAAWPYAGAADVVAEPDAAHQPLEAWLYGGPAPDLFVSVDEALRTKLAEIAGGSPAVTEERFAQVDFRPR